MFLGRTTGGVLNGSDGLTVTSPVEMWLKALDMLLSRIKDSDVDLGRVAAISGAGQQHGSVFCKKGECETFQFLGGDNTL